MELYEFLEMLRGSINDFMVFNPVTHEFIDLSDYVENYRHAWDFKRVVGVGKNGGIIQITLEDF